MYEPGPARMTIREVPRSCPMVTTLLLLSSSLKFDKFSSLPILANALSLAFDSDLYE